MINGFTYYELKDDGVHVHTKKRIGSTLIGEEMYRLTYRQFNRLLQEEAGEVERGNGYEIMDSFMRTGRGNITYLLPVGTYWVGVRGNTLHVKQKIGASNFPFFQSELFSETQYKADFGGVYMVEWKVQGTVHNITGNNITPVDVQKIVNGSIYLGDIETAPVPYLKQKLIREWGRLSATEKKRAWKQGAEPILNKLTNEDSLNRTFRQAFEDSRERRTFINWEGVEENNG
ncbi:hypothetical protein [Bacillus thuringiensis]|uniref:hypothetical protein n=1 Tax=Bacillus thuringiensis TaxID=1428 RepID=UPI000BFB5D29|nr:hypothetical protein [Bacillus thuringiensis]PGT89992.1 hypothetical protein COD17_09590 [Bacillus thuringiensis]